MTIGKIIRNVREARGETRKQFAASLTAEIGETITQYQVTNWEFDRTIPSVWMLRLVADNATGWVRDFAMDAMAAIDEDVERRR